MSNQKITTLDLFAGCGGLTEGFESSGAYSLVGAVEWEKPFRDTLINRLTSKWNIVDADQRVIHFDIQKLQQLFKGFKGDSLFSGHTGLDQLIHKTGQLDLVMGGPPCQAYSVAGRVRDANGMHSDYRNYLFESYVGIVKRYRPKAFVFENVLGMLSAKPGGISIVDRMIESFATIGYHINNNLRDQAVFNTADFGIPQNRRRVIIYGVNKKVFKDYEPRINRFYAQLNKQKEKEVRTVWGAIADLQSFLPLRSNPKSIGRRRFSHHPFITSVKWHYPRFHNDRDIQIFKILAREAQRKNNKYATTEQIKDLYTEVTGKISSVHKYYVLRKNLPSNTIPAHLHKDGLRHIHPDPNQARTISVREAARLQSFSDDFDFLGSQSDAYKMIGNAVPPLFARKIAFAVKENLV